MSWLSTITPSTLPLTTRIFQHAVTVESDRADRNLGSPQQCGAPFSLRKIVWNTGLFYANGHHSIGVLCSNTFSVGCRHAAQRRAQLVCSMSRFETTSFQPACSRLVSRREQMPDAVGTTFGLPPICFLGSSNLPFIPRAAFGSRQTCKAVAVEGDRNRDLDSPRKQLCEVRTPES